MSERENGDRPQQHSPEEAAAQQAHLQRERLVFDRLDFHHVPRNRSLDIVPLRSARRLDPRADG